MNKYQETITGLMFTMEMVTFDPSNGETKTPDSLNEMDKITYDSVKFAHDYLEKYRWHNLLEDTNDLPTKDGPIIIKQGAKYHSGLAIEGKMGNWTTLFSDDGEVFNEFAFVDKWKYIEEFEDE